MAEQQRPCPQLPLNAVPRAVELPAAERYRHVEHWEAEEAPAPAEFYPSELRFEDRTDFAWESQSCPEDSDPAEPDPVAEPACFASECPVLESALPVFESACLAQECGQANKSFQRLLLEIAAEHRRALEEQRKKLEMQSSPQRGRFGNPVQELTRQRTALVLSIPSSPRQTKFFGEKSQGTGSAGLARLRQQASQILEEVGRSPPKPLVFSTETPSKEGHRKSPFDFTGQDDSFETPPRVESSANVAWWTNWRKLLHQAFGAMSTLAILVNSATIGWAADSSMASALAGGMPVEASAAKDLSSVCTAWFALELLIRGCLSGWRAFFCGEGWNWNVFDVLVVGSDVVQNLLEVLHPGGEAAGARNLAVARLLRVLRIARALRILRVVRFFRELRMMVLSVLHSGSTLLWSCVLLAMTIYGFAVYFVQVVAFHTHAVGANDELQKMFGSLIRAVYTLYMAVSGGISWGEVAEQLIAVDVTHGVVFCFYTFFTTFALMNIITGIFVETSISSARSSQEELVQEQLYMTKGLREEMRKIFENADRDCSGTINLAEFEAWLWSQESRAYLEALGVEVDRAKGLFELLDLDMSGEITLEEFTFGCLRLKGGARSIDIATMMNHERKMAEQWRAFFQFTEEQFHSRQDFEERLESRLSLVLD